MGVTEVAVGVLVAMKHSSRASMSRATPTSINQRGTNRSLGKILGPAPAAVRALWDLKIIWHTQNRQSETQHNMYHGLNFCAIESSNYDAGEMEH
ncbi:hypothetical protein SAY86_021589 [Trapa natans]|uniref:Uncharacterized protein n=1 Tax=Trapa natans TaxID=22666 RepID=A0AAN7MA77_TRANT|nr:hypothetical protein SAY86_021589 [Trapa natans]